MFKILRSSIPELVIVEPRVHVDERGFVYESFNQRAFTDLIGISACFVQDNHSHSRRHVLRGLHYQIKHPQGKLIRVTHGEIFDVAVDIRRNSPTYCQWAGTVLSAENRRILWIPAGFAHGFLTLSETADCLYKTTDYWHSEFDRGIRWNDPELAISWPITVAPILSEKDRHAPLLHVADLPVFDSHF